MAPVKAELIAPEMPAVCPVVAIMITAVSDKIRTTTDLRPLETVEIRAIEMIAPETAAVCPAVAIMITAVSDKIRTTTDLRPLETVEIRAIEMIAAGNGGGRPGGRHHDHCGFG